MMASRASSRLDQDSDFDPRYGDEGGPRREDGPDLFAEGQRRIQREPKRGEPASDESVGRILSSLDRLSSRIRSLSLDTGNSEGRAPFADRDTTPDDIQRAVERMGYRDERPEPRSARRDLSDLAARVEALARQSPRLRPQASLDDDYAPRSGSGFADSRSSGGGRGSEGWQACRDMKADLAALRDLIVEARTDNPTHLLEAGFDQLVRRLDDMRGAIDNPRALNDLVLRLSEIRRMFGALPTDTHFHALNARVDALLSRLDENMLDERLLGDLERHLGEIAKAVTRLDQREVIQDIGTRLTDVSDRIASFEQRLGRLDSLDRWTETTDRQTSLLSQLTQRTEQLPRFAHELERQAATVDRISKTTDSLPTLARDLGAIRDTLSGGSSESRAAFSHLLTRIDELSAQLASGQGQQDHGWIAAFEAKLADILTQLDRQTDGLDDRALQQLDARFADLDTRFADLGARLDQQASQVGAAVAPSFVQLVEALSRIEERLSDPLPLTRLDEIERQIGALAGSDVATAQDMAALDHAVQDLRSEIASMAEQSAGRFETELRTIAQRLDDLQVPGHELHGFIRIEERIADLAAHVTGRQDPVPPQDTARLSATLGQLEEMLGRLQTIEEGRKRSGDEGRVELITALDSNLKRVADDLRSEARRDRELLLAIGEAVERLAEREIALQPVPAEPVAAAPAPSLKTGNTDGESSWDTIEKVLTSTLGRREKKATEPEAAAAKPAPSPTPPVKPADAQPVMTAPDAIEEDLPRIFGRRQAAAERVEPVLSAAAIEEDLDIDADRPLEPGSGKPTFTAKAHSAGDEPQGAAKAGPAQDPQAPPSKADFIAAARRAALAAGAETPSAAAKTRATEPKGDKQQAFLPVYAFLRKNRRALMMGAIGILVVLGASRLVATYLSHPRQTVVETTAPSLPAPVQAPAATGPAAEQSMAPAPADTSTAASPEPQNTPAAVAELPPPPAATEASPAPAGPATTELAASSTSDPAQTFVPSAIPVPGATSVPAESPAAAVAATAPLPPAEIGPMALREAASKGDALAQFEVATRYADGKGIKADLAEAIVWYQRAADAGLAPAQYRLGSLSEKGQGTPRDPKLAAQWYEKAATKGNAKAMHNLAVLNASGALGEPNYQMAVKWFQGAADLGVRDSQFNLGILYARGLGVQRDLATSYKWFAIAANAGDTDSAKKRDDVAQVLSKDDLARARLAVETWVAKPQDPAANDVDTSNPAWTAKPDDTASVDQTELIQRAQTALAGLGYDPGPADGRMGKRTRDAIMSYQKAQGLPQTGEIDQKLLAAISMQTL